MEVDGSPSFLALVDSGATHALRAASSEAEWASAQPVVVSLAGSETSAMRLSAAGTLLLPPTSSAQTIVPLGSVIQQLGYRLDWTASRCRLITPSGRAFRLRVKGGCPEIMESEALVLISKLEEKRLEDLKSLEANVAEGTSRIRTVKALMSKGWWDHLQDYVSLGSTNSAQLALQAAPFLADVPQAALQGLVEELLQERVREAERKAQARFVKRGGFMKNSGSCSKHRTLALCSYSRLRPDACRRASLSHGRPVRGE